MNIRICSILVFVLGIAFSGCNQGQVPEATLIPAPSNTPTPSSTATSIPTPTSTPAPIPVSLVYRPVPRWMILDQPFYDVEILGEIWNYTNDRWGDTYACISYSREQDTSIEFEQCFTSACSDEVSFESQHNQFLSAGFEELTPQNTFGNASQVSLLGKRLSGDTNEVIEFFEIVGIGDYVTLVELYIEIDDSNALQAI